MLVGKRTCPVEDKVSFFKPLKKPYLKIVISTSLYLVKTNLPKEMCPKVPRCTTTKGIPALLLSEFSPPPPSPGTVMIPGSSYGSKFQV